MGVKQLLSWQKDPSRDQADLRQLDALVNHILCVQLLHEHFVANNIPRYALKKAHELGWRLENKLSKSS